MSPSVRAQVSQRVRDITPAQRLRANKSKFFRSPHGYLARFVLGIRPIVGGLGPAERAIGQHFQPLRKMLTSVCACREVPKPSCYGEAVLLSPRTADAACSTADATFSEKDTGADSPAPAVARRDSAPRGSDLSAFRLPTMTAAWWKVITSFPREWWCSAILMAHHLAIDGALQSETTRKRSRKHCCARDGICPRLISVGPCPIPQWGGFHDIDARRQLNGFCP